MRADLADVRLADRIFAPHYAAPLPMRLTAAAALAEGRDTRAAATLTTLSAGDRFDLLDVTGGTGWGIAIDSGLVGYLDAALLEPVA